METAYLSHSPSAKQWSQIAIKPHHGIAIPLFSLHSEHSTGIGEFPDLIPLIDWCVSVGFDVIQLLPLNDTGMRTSPYSAHSAFTLNPIYLGLNTLPYLNDHPLLLEELKAIPKFSYSTMVDYTLVREHKMHFLSHYFDQAGFQIIASESYKSFIKEAGSWLRIYSIFKVLKKRNDFFSWECWPEEERYPTLELIERLDKEEEREIQFFTVLQFLCDLQMREVKAHAEKNEVFLMGDIPILIDRNSADVWGDRDLFDLNYSAGAPPDMYCEEGQNWGFPLYKWEVHAQTNYQWWRNRLKWASRYYHIYRIDHIVGFFRIWAIPYGLTAKEGHFNPEDRSLWCDHGQRLMLMMLDSSDMLPIGEDLGVIPPEVRACLNALGICGTKVMRWERKWDENKNFIPPQEYPVISLTTVSTHDSETLQQWWQNKPEESQIYAASKGWSYQTVLSREYHREILWDSHHTRSLFHINPLQEYLALIPGLTWPSIDDERINTPGIISEHNWSYRLRPSIEELNSNFTLKNLMRKIIE